MKIHKHLISILLLVSPAVQAIPNTGIPNTFLGPYFRAGLTTQTNWEGAYSLAAEGGVHNIRFNGTLGWLIMDNQRMKFTGEFSSQEMEYSFFSANTTQWVHQGALGMNYQYAFDPYSWYGHPEFDLNMSIAHAPSDAVRTNTGTYVNSSGTTLNYVDQRRIAGSDAVSVSPGLIAQLWEGGHAGLTLNYDNVSYDTRYTTESARGFGGTARMTHDFGDNTRIGFSAGVRKPFNLYQANIAWFNLPYFGKWTIGVNGDYTVGKDTLPSTYNVGLSADYFFDKSTTTALSDKRDAENFLNWIATPAVHQTQGLGIADDKVTVG